MAHESFSRHFDFFAHGSDPVVISSADLVFLGAYSRTGDDLVIGRTLESVTVHDYFKPGNHPDIQAPDGATLSNAVVSAMTMFHGGEQYAENAAAAAAPKAIGRVEEVSGTAEAIRSGQNINLHPGDLVYKGDAVQTGADSSLALTFLDGTAFSLAADARMVLNDMTYEPKSLSNSSLLTLVQGSIGFVAGDVAHSGDMKVDTPVATMGIRGTAVKSRVNSDQGKGEFSLLREPDGHVGSIVFYDHRGSGAVLGFLSSASTVLSFEFTNGQLTSKYSPSTDLDNTQDQELTKFLFHIRQLGLDHPLREELGLDQPGGGQGGHGGSPQTPEQEQRQEQGGNAGPPNGDLQHQTAVILTQPLSSTVTTQLTVTGPSMPPNTGVSVSYPTPTVGGTIPVPDPPTLPPGSGGGDTFSLVSTTGTYGTASINSSTGVVTYTETSAPAPGTAPTDTFSVLVKNSQGVTATTTASFVVDGGGSASYATQTVGTTSVTDTPTKVLSPEGGDTYALVNATGTYGTAAIDKSTGAITYTPTVTLLAGQSAPDTFTVTTTDSLGVKTTSTAIFVVDGGGSASYATETVGTTPVTDTPTKVLSPEGGDTYALVNANGAYGTAAIDASGVITYTPSTTTTPAMGTTATDTFTVTTTDSLGVKTTSTASFVVDGGAAVSYTTPTVAGTSPVSDAVSVTTAPGIAVSDTFSLVNAQGTYGTASINALAGVVTYTETSAPPAGTPPTETFAVKVTDSLGVTTSAMASFLVDGGAAVSYTPNVSVGTTAVVDAPTVTSAGAGNDTFALVSANGTYGTATIDSSTGVITYTPTVTLLPGQASPDELTVNVTDAAGVTTTTTATFVIYGPEDPPLPPGQYTISAPTSAIYGFPSDATTNLTLAQPSTFSGQFSGFAGSDTIDLKGFDYSSATFSENYVAAANQLVVTVTEEGKATTLTFDNFDPAKQALKFASDGAGGTLISEAAVGSSASAHVFATSQTIIPAPSVEKSVSISGHSGRGDGDNFTFKPNAGNPVTTDFHAHSANGPTDFAAAAAFHFAPYQALLGNVTETPVGDDASHGAHSVTLDGAHAAQLHASLFLV
jgi:VCBS repeat-containing protein